MKKLRLPEAFPKKAALYTALAASTALMNFSLPQREPLSFALLFAALSCGLDPFLCGGAYIIASASALSLQATLCCALQAAALVLISCIYRRYNRSAGWERAAYAAAAQIPFIFLFPHAGYALFSFSVVWQKTVIAAFFFLLSLLFDGGLEALLRRAFRCRLNAQALAEISLMWLFLGMGIFNAFGATAFTSVCILFLLAAVCLTKSSASVPFAVVLSLPICVMKASAAPCAIFAVYACLGLLFIPYGKTAATLAAGACYVAVQYLSGVFDKGAAEIVFSLLAFALPALACVCTPESIYKRAEHGLLFYRERTLPRVAINRNRRAVGEQLYEISALFREIENAFTDRETTDHAGERIREQLTEKLCAGCPSRRRCEKENVGESLDKLIAVGCAKGRVNLIDLPADVSALCGNSAGLLFALNKQLAEYRRCAHELESAREGRRLLAEQARGVSEILRGIALEQSEEYSFSEGEKAVSAALSASGILSSEIFVYGEGGNLTVSMTLKSGLNGKRVCEIAGNALGVPLALAEKIPLTADRACYVLKRKANFDAAFGVASVPKEGEQASGDTHSILKIDERRFLVALSDGMGSGEEAREVSDRALNLLESCYKAKMPSQTVLSTVNKLIAYSSDERFACLDTAAVNLDTGTADIVKIGSPVGFLLSGEELRVLEGESLPIGMLEAVHPATMRVNMKENDFLIFMSDGVTTAFGSPTELCAYLSALRPLNPQSLAEEILSAALKRYGGKADDDMTVLAVRLMKAA